MRAFIAIDIPESIKEKILEISKELSSQGITLVKKEAFHINLYFLGEISEENAGEIGKNLKLIKASPFQASISGLDCFTPQKIRVIFAKVVEGKDELVSVYNQISEFLIKKGFKSEKDFTPHVTLARIRSIRDKEKLISLIKKNSQNNFGSFTVNSIKLKSSVLSRDGPIYKDLYEFNF